MNCLNFIGKADTKNDRLPVKVLSPCVLCHKWNANLKFLITDNFSSPLFSLFVQLSHILILILAVKDSVHNTWFLASAEHCLGIIKTRLSIWRLWRKNHNYLYSCLSFFLYNINFVSFHSEYPPWPDWYLQPFFKIFLDLPTGYLSYHFSMSFCFSPSTILCVKSFRNWELLCFPADECYITLCLTHFNVILAANSSHEPQQVLAVTSQYHFHFPWECSCLGGIKKTKS